MRPVEEAWIDGSMKWFLAAFGRARVELEHDDSADAGSEALAAEVAINTWSEGAARAWLRAGA